MIILQMTSMDLLKTVALTHLFCEGAITSEEYCEEAGSELSAENAREFRRMIAFTKETALRKISTGRN